MYAALAEAIGGQLRGGMRSRMRDGVEEVE
jgi:hypothetical protein